MDLKYEFKLDGLDTGKFQTLKIHVSVIEPLGNLEWHQ